LQTPEDRLSALRKKIGDYLNLGIPNVWPIDPQERRAWIETREGSFESGDLVQRASDSELTLDLREVFAALQ
jgi:Uma2 family endonuclease